MPKVKSYVTEVKIEEKNGNQTATVTVKLKGFEQGEHVQLSGYAAQRDGGFVAISRDYKIGALDHDGAADLKVDSTPSQRFVKDTEVISGLWAAKVWLTVLDHDATGWVWNSTYSAPQDDGNWGS
jgi:hypothetical protein